MSPRNKSLMRCGEQERERKRKRERKRERERGREREKERERERKREREMPVSCLTFGTSLTYLQVKGRVARYKTWVMIVSGFLEY